MSIWDEATAYDPKDSMTHPNNMSIMEMVFSKSVWMGRCTACGAIKAAYTKEDIPNSRPCDCESTYESVGWAPKGTLVTYHEMAVAG